MIKANSTLGAWWNMCQIFSFFNQNYTLLHLLETTNWSVIFTLLLVHAKLPKEQKSNLNSRNNLAGTLDSTK